VIAVIASACVIVISSFAGNILAMLMQDEIDRRIPGPARDSFTRWNICSFSEYHKKCPDGKLHIYSIGAFGVMIIGFVVLFLSLIFIDNGSAN